MGMGARASLLNLRFRLLLLPRRNNYPRNSDNDEAADKAHLSANRRKQARRAIHSGIMKKMLLQVAGTLLVLVLFPLIRSEVVFKDTRSPGSDQYSVLIGVHLTNQTACALPYFLKSLIDVQCPFTCSIRLCLDDDIASETRALIASFVNKFSAKNVSFSDEACSESDPFSVLAAAEAGFSYALALNPTTLITDPRNLIEKCVSKQKPVMAPLFRSPFPSLTSNFATDDMYYYEPQQTNRNQTTNNYGQIINQHIRGCFPVPSIAAPFFVDLNFFRKSKIEISDFSYLSSSDIGHPVYVCNRDLMGNIVRYSSLYRRNPELICDGFDHLLSEYQLTGQNKTYIAPPDSFPEFLPLKPKNTKYFDRIDKTYVINLERRQDRKVRIKETLDLLGLKAEIIKAVDGLTLTQDDLKKDRIKVLDTFVDPYNRRTVNMGEVACFLSHYKLWEDARKKGYKTILVLEDDARFEFLFSYYLNYTLSRLEQLNREWDMIYLGRKIMGSGEKFLADVDTLVTPFYSHWTVAYLLSAQGVRKLLDQRPLEKLIPVDEYLPLMFDQHPNEQLKTYFSPRDLVTFAFQPVIVQPTHYYGESNYVSDTENTTIVEII